jgi:hypothetical protein
MAEIFVQFADATEKVIVAAFGCAQDETAWPNQGIVANSDSRWAAYYATIPIGAQAAWPEPTS